MKLSAETMRALHDAVAWDSAPAPQVDAFVRRWLVSYVNDYRARGAAAMPVFDDTREGERSADGFAQLLAEDATLLDGTAALAGAPDARSTIYWMREQRPGLSPILSVVQRTAVGPVVADKQLYASHYLDALLDVWRAVDAAPDAGAPRLHLVLVRRAKFDHLPRGGLFSLRGRIVSRLRDDLRASLDRVRRALESN